MQSEMMNDQMDMVMDNGDMQDQAEEVYQQILGEIGMNINAEVNAGKGKIGEQEAAQQQLGASEDADLQARLDALKNM